MSADASRVSLTFDNGPNPGVTERVLDLLRDRGVRTTFFLIGQRLAAPGARELAERARAEGHWIGNHTWSHSEPLGHLADADAVHEIERAQSVMGDLAHPDRLFRPMGAGGNLDQRLFSPAALQALLSGGYTTVLWNGLARDWVDPGGWVERALALCRDGALLVLHDTPSGAMDQLERFLAEAARAGVRFVQDFPPECVPIRRGQVVRPLEDFVTTATGAPPPQDVR